MKEFVIYTGLRILLFIACLVTVSLGWSLVDADREVPMVWAAIIAFASSGVLSYFLLSRQREAFAQRVDERAKRASQRFEEMKAREDVD